MDTGILYGCITPHPPILVPAVAGSRVDQVRQTRLAMETVAQDVETVAPDVIVLVSPHAPIFPYAMGVCGAERYVGGFEDFGAASPRLTLEGDPILASEILTACRAMKVPVEAIGRSSATHRLDHGAAVPLYFLNAAGVNSRLVLLAFSGLDVDTHLRFGRAIAAATRVAGRRAVMVASGDLSHRLIPGAPAGYSPAGKQFDEAVVSAIGSGETSELLLIDEEMRSKAGECGYRSLVIVTGAMPEGRPEVLSYEGPFGVGYLVARIVHLPPPEATEPTLEKEVAPPCLAPDEQAALRLVREAVETFVETGKVAPVQRHLEGVLAETAGVFICLKSEGQLRGCIGTFTPTESSVAKEIVRNAIAAASRDPRFPPIIPDELAGLSYSIDVLSRPEQVDDEGQLDPVRYGVIVQRGGRRGLLLPSLEGVSSVATQLEIARRKAGIAPGEPVEIWRFTVRRISE